MGDQLHTVESAAKLLDCRPLKVYRMIWTKRLRAVDLNNPPRPPKGYKPKRSEWRVPQSAIDELGREDAGIPAVRIA